jgi:hypothetical protein
VTVAYVGSSAVPSGTTATSITTTLTLTYPSNVEGDLLVLMVGVKPDTASVTTPTDWSDVSNGEAAGGGGTTGADTGPTRLKTMYRVVPSGGLTGTLNITLASTPNVSWGIFMTLRGYGSSWSVAGANGIDSTTGTPFTATMGSDPGIATDDVVLVGGCIPTDVTTPAQFSAETLTATGVTFGTVTEIGEPDSTSGNDIGGVLCWAPATAGSSSAAAVFSATAGGTTTNVRGPIVLVRARESTAPPSSGIYEVLNAAPAAVTATTTSATTASFTPPANTLLVAVAECGNTTGTGTVTAPVTDSLSSSWTLLHRANGDGNGSTEVWAMDTGSSPAARTVTVTGTGGAQAIGVALNVTVLAGTKPAATVEGASAAANATTAYTVTITTTAAGSLVVGGITRWISAVTLVTDAATRSWQSVSDATNTESYGAWRAAAVTGTPGATTFGYTNAAAASNSLVAVELLAAAVPAGAGVIPRRPFRGLIMRGRR